MKKYLLFAFSKYYPAGGIDDLIGNYDTIEDAVKYAKLWKCTDYEQYFQIVEHSTMKIIQMYYADYSSNTFLPYTYFN